MSIRVPVQSYFEDPDHRMIDTPLSDEAYAHAMRSFIIVCVDVIFINRERHVVYLAKRRHKPLPQLWMIGGRARAGEEWVDAMRRKLKAETSVDIAPERFEFLRINRYRWKDREQEPQDAGSDNLSIVYAVELTQEELATASANLDAEEYERDAGLHAFNRLELTAANVHPAIVDILDQLFCA